MLKFKVSAHRRLLAVVSASVICGVISATDASAAAVFSSGSDASATLAAGVRYRNLANTSGGAAEVFVFASPCCDTPTSGQGTWTSSSPISITYDGTADTLSTTAAGTTTTRTGVTLGALNYIEITVTKNASTGSVALTTIKLNGGSSLGDATVNSAPNTRVWNITGETLTSGFTLSGTIATSSLNGGGDSNFVQVEVGNVPPSDNEGPITSSVTTDPIPALLNGLVTVSANVSDVTTGNNNVASAEYSLNGDPYQPMTAADLVFDSPNEDVEASFYATTVGTNEVCVRGTDSLANLGTASCQNFLVTYKFDGFFPPIDNLPDVNLVKAGQAIPAKWRLTDANDVPIADPDSFDSLQSYPVNCTDFAGDPLDAVEEAAAGSSGLQYLGDGYWQYNWKTVKATYADTCRVMFVEFNSGALSPATQFRFKK
jgi:hypothetical protein